MTIPIFALSHLKSDNLVMTKETKDAIQEVLQYVERLVHTVETTGANFKAAEIGHDDFFNKSHAEHMKKDETIRLQAAEIFKLEEQCKVQLQDAESDMKNITASRDEWQVQAVSWEVACNKSRKQFEELDVVYQKVALERDTANASLRLTEKAAERWEARSEGMAEERDRWQERAEARDIECRELRVKLGMIDNRELREAGKPILAVDPLSEGNQLTILHNENVRLKAEIDDLQRSRGNPEIINLGELLSRLTIRVSID